MRLSARDLKYILSTDTSAVQRTFKVYFISVCKVSVRLSRDSRSNRQNRHFSMQTNLERPIYRSITVLIFLLTTICGTFEDPDGASLLPVPNYSEKMPF